MLDASTAKNGHAGAHMVSGGGKRGDATPAPKTIADLVQLLRGNRQGNNARVTCWIGPALAQELLGKNHPQNRGLSQATLRRYIREHEAKRFRYTPSPLVIDSNGTLGDGQHRCSMVAQTGAPLLADVVQMFNADEFENARINLDTGKTRTRGHVLEIAGLVPTGKGALANSILTHIGYFHDAIDMSRSNMEQVATFRPWAAGINFALARRGRRWTIAMRAAVAVCYKHNPGATEEMLRQYEAGTDLKVGMPAHALTRMEAFFGQGRGRAHDESVMLFIFKAAHAHSRCVTLRASEKSVNGYSTRPSPFALDFFFGEHLRQDWRERSANQRHVKDEE